MASADGLEGDGRRRNPKPGRSEPDSNERTTFEFPPHPDTPSVIPDNSIGERHIDFNSITGRHLSAVTIEVGKFIQSEGFESGVIGWQIDGEGNAEFNSVLIRGTFKTAEDGARVQIDERGVPAIGWLPGIRLHNGHDLDASGDPGQIWMEHTGADDEDLEAQSVVKISSGNWGDNPAWARIELYGATSFDAEDYLDSLIWLRAVDTVVAGNLVVNGDEGDGSVTILGDGVDNAYKGEHGGEGAGVYTRTSGNIVSFDWTGAALRIYMNDVFVIEIDATEPF